MSFFRAFSIIDFISEICSCGVLRNCCSQCFLEPLQSKFTTFPPACLIHLIEIPSSMNPKISILFE